MNNQQMVVVASTVAMVGLGVAALVTKKWNTVTVDGKAQSGMGNGIWGDMDTKFMSNSETVAIWSVRVLGVLALVALLAHAFIEMKYPGDAKKKNYSVGLLALAGACASASALTFWFKFDRIREVDAGKKLEVKAGMSVYMMLAFGVLALSGAAVLASRK